jgi:HAD superfamily hydrolase (TIGR01490 family)
VDGRAPIVAFDFDGTLLEGHSPVRMVSELSLRRVIPYSTAFAALWWGIRYRLRVPVEQKEVREYIFNSFARFPAQEADSIMSRFYRDKLRPLLRPKALAAIKAHKEAGDTIVLVSASFSPILKEVLRDVDADWFISTQMEVAQGFYTGKVSGQPPEGEQKIIQLRAWADARYGEKGWLLATAYGDHRSDEPLLRAATRAVAVNPDTGLERTARREGWPIVDWRLKGDPTRGGKRDK